MRALYEVHFIKDSLVNGIIIGFMLQFLEKIFVHIEFQEAIINKTQA